MRVLVCGGRNYNDRAAVFRMLDALAPSVVITGGCPTGADMHADRWTYERGVQIEHHPADWERYGRAAGPIRNQAMLNEARPDLVLAFPGGKGTADMVKRAEVAGVAVRYGDARGGI
jgi:YspA, cpYpsA-related SLOG family